VSLSPHSRYREFRPAAGLDRWVGRFWSQTILPGAETFFQRVLPDGCVDIVWIDSGPARVVGPATQPFVERLAPGTSIVGVRFRPGAAAAALNVDASELRNLQPELAAVMGDTAARQFDPIGDAPTPAAQLPILERTMRTYLMRRPPPDPGAIALAAAIEFRIGLPVRDAVGAAGAGGSGISERQARRRFRQAVGYGPKAFQRIARLARLREWAARDGVRSRTLAQLAYDLGYADQAHLTREVTRLAGMSPAVFLRVAPTIQAISDYGGRNLQDGKSVAR